MRRGKFALPVTLPIALAALGILNMKHSVAANAVNAEVHLEDGAGKPINWGQNSFVYQGQNEQGASFKIAPPLGATTLLGAFLLFNDNGVISSPSPGVTITGDPAVNGAPMTLGINAAAIDNSLRSASALAWSGDKLFVAEAHSNDDADHYVYEFSRRGDRSRRLDTVLKPRAIAVSASTLFVAGEEELAAFDARSGRKLWSQKPDFCKSIGQLALLGDKLFVGEKSGDAVRVLAVKDGTPRSQFSGEGENLLKTEIGHSNIGVCATKQNTLYVSDAFAVREFDTNGTFLRKIADVRGGSSIACDPAGNVAVSIIWAKDKDNGAFPEIWKFDAQGQPVQRFVAVYMRGPAGIDKRPSDDPYKMRTFGGVTAKLSSPGGLAFDDLGNLYIGDRNDIARSDKEFYNTTRDMNMDGGVLKVSAAGEFEARWGSRFSDDGFVRAGLEKRKNRAPLQRTQAAIAAGKTLRLLVWGDSITQTDPSATGWHGGASADAKNWVHVLARLLEHKFPPLQVKEEANGVGGQNVAESLARNPIGGQSYRPPDDLILIELGTNDQVFHIRTTAQFELSLREMLKGLRAFTDSDIVLVAPGPIFDTLAPSPPAAYNEVMKKLGREFNIPVVDMATAVDRKVAAGTPLDSLLTQPRNVHPNDAGHELWAQATLEVLTQNLPEKTP